MDRPLLRWGILVAANITRKNWKAIWNSRNGFKTQQVMQSCRESARKQGRPVEVDSRL
jgi:hypothetical protein